MRWGERRARVDAGGFDATDAVRGGDEEVDGVGDGAACQIHAATLPPLNPAPSTVGVTQLGIERVMTQKNLTPLSPLRQAERGSQSFQGEKLRRISATA